MHTYASPNFRIIHYLNVEFKLFVRFQVLTAAIIKMFVFWVVALLRLWKRTDVSEVFVASVIRAMSPF
jgi:hypothetical protein